MPQVSIDLTLSGANETIARLAALREKCDRHDAPSMEAASWMAGQTLRAFREGGRPEKWAPLSLMTMFIRAHRVQSPHAGSQPLRDSGRLEGSMSVFSRDQGREFGVSTNVDYATTMQRGGLTTENVVRILNFRRRNPHVMTGGEAKSASGVRSRKLRRQVRASMTEIHKSEYELHLNGGAAIPARPFFPETIPELQNWGYLAAITRIFEKYFRSQAIGGTA